MVKGLRLKLVPLKEENLDLRGEGSAFLATNMISQDGDFTRSKKGSDGSIKFWRDSNGERLGIYSGGQEEEGAGRQCTGVHQLYPHGR